jgi:hypothetical protein
MPFDPNYPTDGNPFLAEPMRQQLLSLKAMIDAIVTLNAAQVDVVNTVNSGQPANAAVTVDGSTLRFTFDIPRGADGANGSDGATGPQGPAFANAIVDSVTTIDPGQPAGVSVGFDGNTVHFTFAIPRGSDGNQGPSGNDGAQGPPGEVTIVQLNDAIGGTSNNTNSVATLDSPFADADMETLRVKMNEMILAARR